MQNVASGRIKIYKADQAVGLSNDGIRQQLQADDRNQPASYKALVGKSEMVNPETR